MNLQSYPLGTLTAIASLKIKKLAEQLLTESLATTGNHRFQNVGDMIDEIMIWDEKNKFNKQNL